MLPFRSIAIAATLSAVVTIAPATAQAPRPTCNPVHWSNSSPPRMLQLPHPADALLLAKLDKDQPIEGAEIIILGEHVDYWDQQGWHDRFSSHQYTERQNDYGERLHVQNVYTPQMIVDGTEQFLGNDAAHAQKAIQHAAQGSKLSLSLSKPVVSTDAKSPHPYPLSAAATAHDPRGDLYAATGGPEVDVTDVRRKARTAANACSTRAWCAACNASAA